jgi:putative transposase
LGGG